MSVFHVGNRAAVPVFVRFPSAFSVCVRHNRSGYLTFRTTNIKDTKLTLVVIPFKVEANNSLNFLALQTYEEKVAEFPSLLRNTIP